MIVDARQFARAALPTRKRAQCADRMERLRSTYRRQTPGRRAHKGKIEITQYHDGVNFLVPRHATVKPGRLR